MPVQAGSRRKSCCAATSRLPTAAPGATRKPPGNWDWTAAPSRARWTSGCWARLLRPVGHGWGRRSDDLDAREIASIPGGMAREQREPADGRVRADVKIGQGRLPRTSAPPVSHKALSRQESRLPGERFPSIQGGRNGGVERLDGAVSDRHFGIYDRIDHQAGVLGDLREGARGPLAPIGIVRSDVKQDVRSEEHTSEL